MVTAPVPGFGVIVPVYNEAAIIGETAPALLSALAGQGAAVVFVCNGVQDGSDRILAEVLATHEADSPDPRCQLIILETAGKPGAIRAGEAALPVFPRFYVDADVVLTPETLPALAAALRAGAADLMSPRIVFDTTRATPLAAAMARLWLDLPHGRRAAYHHVIGLNAAGRGNWGLFPDVLGDDAFIETQVPEYRQKVLEHVSARTMPPLSFADAVRVRMRWLAGHRQLEAMGLATPHVSGQRRALWPYLWSRRAPAAWAYLAARLLAGGLSRLPRRRGSGGKQGWAQSR